MNLRFSSDSGEVLPFSPKPWLSDKKRTPHHPSSRVKRLTAIWAASQIAVLFLLMTVVCLPVWAAAKKGYHWGLNNLGVMYEFGWGVRRDYKKALEWYRKAVKQGLTTSMYRIGRMYERGCGVPKLGHEALDWYQKAAKLGNEAAKKRIAAAMRAQNGVPRAPVYWKDSGRCGTPSGQGWRDLDLTLSALVGGDRFQSSSSSNQTVNPPVEPARHLLKQPATMPGRSVRRQVLPSLSRRPGKSPKETQGRKERHPVPPRRRWP